MGIEFVKGVESWGKQTKSELAKKVRATASKDSTGYLAKSIGSKVASKQQSPQSVRFTFERYGVFFEKGVGKYRGILSAQVKPKPWFNPTIDNQIEELAQIAADNMAAIAADKLTIR